MNKKVTNLTRGTYLIGLGAGLVIGIAVSNLMGDTHFSRIIIYGIGIVSLIAGYYLSRKA